MPKGRFRYALLLHVTAWAVFFSTGCENEHLETSLPGQWTVGDASVTDFMSADLPPLPDGLPVMEGGPTIKIISPAVGIVVTGDLLKVEATITDNSQVDPSSITVTIQGQGTVPMALSGTGDIYQALLDVSAIDGAARLWITAADMTGKENTEILEFSRDGGPLIQILSPSEDGQFKGSVLIQINVVDPTPLATFEVLLGDQQLKLEKKTISPDTTFYSGTLEAADYDPLLSGQQILTAIGKNDNQASARVTRSFSFDDQGPTITIKSHTPGQVIGPTVFLQAEVTDPAGLLASSVQCVVGDGPDAVLIQLFPSISSPDLFEGQFDSRTFTRKVLWPVLSFRAADVLGNESHEDIQVGLDTGAPVMALDPQSQVYLGRYVEGVLECSHPFDPLGSDAADDITLVPQVVPIRARIEDQGNPVLSALFAPISLVDPATVWLYILDGTTKPLLVDSTGDGYCDSISPEVMPLSSVPQAGKALAVKLEPVPVAGAADFSPILGFFPFTSCHQGTDEPSDAPLPLCDVTDLTMAIPYADGASEPALWAIPSVIPASNSRCLGLPFDFGANQMEDGWVCAAVAAADHVGNPGVSPPLRLWVQKNAFISQKGDLPPAGSGAPPSCTGTLNPSTGKVNAGAPCKFRVPNQDFRQTFPGNSLIIQH